MRTRQLATSLLAATLAVTLCAGAGSATARADTILWMGGTSGSLGQKVPAGLFGSPADFLGGAYQDHTFQSVPYPASLWPLTGLHDPRLGTSVSQGVDDLLAAVHNTIGPIIVAGVSQGAMVVQRAQFLLNLDPTVPSSTKFIMIADPDLGVFTRLHGRQIPLLDYVPRSLPKTRFDTVVITNQYDGFAHPSGKLRKGLTKINAILGTAFVHSTAHTTDLSTVPDSNITVTRNRWGGTTTSYFVPTEQLPLTMPLRRLGVPDRAVDKIDAALRPIIDAGYKTRLGQRYAAAATAPSSAAPMPKAAATRPATAQRRHGSGNT